MADSPLIQKPITGGVPECNVTDEFLVGLKDATLRRTIRYRNPWDTAIPINLKSENTFPYHCEEFSATVNQELCEIKVKSGHTKITTIICNTIDLKPKEELIIQIECIWRDFYNYLHYFHYSFQYNERAGFELIIRNSGLNRTLHIIQINDVVVTQGYLISDDYLAFKEVRVDSNTTVTYRISAIDTPVELGVLKTIEDKNPNIFSNFAVIVIQHLLSDAVHLIENFSSHGADKDGIFIIGIPYSTKHHTVNYLRCKGYKNLYAPMEYETFEEVVRKVMNAAIEYSENNQKAILIVEDGGYAVPLLHYEFADKKGLFIGAVEQTANGIWRDEDIKAKKGIDYFIPIIDVAQSDIKKSLESPLIGKTVSKNIELIYNKSYRGIAGRKVALIGYGSTGAQVAKYLKYTEALVTVFDIKEENLKQAGIDGFAIKASIQEIIKESEIIVEATGRPWADDPSKMMDIIMSFSNGSYFASASSKRMGIGYEEFEKLIEAKSMVNLPGIGVKVKLRSGNEVTLIANGYPINFFLGESVPDIEIGFIISWLYKAAEILAKNYSEIPLGIINTNVKDDWGFNDAQKTIFDNHNRLR